MAEDPDQRDSRPDGEEEIARTPRHQHRRQRRSQPGEPCPDYHRRHDRSQDAPVCRWLAGSALLDVMPTDRAVLGFGNRWYDEAVRTAVTHALPSGTSIRLITAPVFIATKLEAFGDRGDGDFLASHDLEDIIAIIDGRPALADEAAVASPEIRRHLSAQMKVLLQSSAFLNALPGHLPGDSVSQARLPLILERMQRLSGLA